MPKSATQRMTPAQINAAYRAGADVAVYTGFKRGFTMGAQRASIHRTGCPREVYASVDDLIGRTIHDGVAVFYADQDPQVEDYHIVAPTDLLGQWDSYTEERDAINAAREKARANVLSQRRVLDAIAASRGGVVTTYNSSLGVFLPYSSVIALGDS